MMNILLAYIAGCIGMMRGGSSKFPTIANTELFGTLNTETGGRKIHRWAAVMFQLVVITPFVLYHTLNLALIPLYVAGWYLTIASGYGKFFQIRTLKEAYKFFLRMLHSFAIFAPIALIIERTWSSLIHAVEYANAFALAAVVIYKIYNILPAKYRHDDGYNWGEFILYALLALMTFSLMRG